MSESFNTDNKWHGLILPDGYGEFNKRREMFDVKRENDKKTFLETGFQPDPKSRQHEEIPEPRGWVLPGTFCVDCGKTDIGPQENEFGRMVNPSRGPVIAAQNYPDLDLRMGDLIIVSVCHACMMGDHKGKDVELPDGTSARDRRRSNNTHDMIRSMKLRGYEPIDPSAPQKGGS